MTFDATVGHAECVSDARVGLSILEGASPEASTSKV